MTRWGTPRKTLAISSSLYNKEGGADETGDSNPHARQAIDSAP